MKFPKNAVGTTERIRKTQKHDKILIDGKKKQKSKKDGIIKTIERLLQEHNWNIEEAVSFYFKENENSQIDPNYLREKAESIINDKIEKLSDDLRNSDESTAIKKLKDDLQSEFIPKKWIWAARKKVLEEMLLENLDNERLTSEQYIKEKLQTLDGNDLGINILERITEKYANKYRAVYAKMRNCLDKKNYNVEMAVEEYIKEEDKSTEKEDEHLSEAQQNDSTKAGKNEKFKNGIKALDNSEKEFLTYVAESINNRIKKLLNEYMSELDFSYEEVINKVREIISNTNNIPKEWIDDSKLSRFRSCINNGYTMQESIEMMRKKEIISGDFSVPDEWVTDVKDRVIQPRLFNYIHYPNVYDESVVKKIEEETGISLDNDKQVVADVRYTIISNKLVEYSKEGEKNIDRLCERVKKETKRTVPEKCRREAVAVIVKDLTEEILNTGDFKTYTLVSKSLREIIGIANLDKEIENIIRDIIKNRNGNKYNLRS